MPRSDESMSEHEMYMPQHSDERDQPRRERGQGEVAWDEQQKLKVEHRRHVQCAYVGTGNRRIARCPTPEAWVSTMCRSPSKRS